MSQTIRLQYDTGLAAKLFLWDAAGEAVGDAAGYDLVETPVGSGHYVTAVPDGLSGSPLTAELEVDGVFETSDSLYLTGVAGSSAVVGSASPPPSAAEIANAVAAPSSAAIASEVISRLGSTDRFAS